MILALGKDRWWTQQWNLFEQFLKYNEALFISHLPPFKLLQTHLLYVSNIWVSFKTVHFRVNGSCSQNQNKENTLRKHSYLCVTPVASPHPLRVTSPPILGLTWPVYVEKLHTALLFLYSVERSTLSLCIFTSIGIILKTIL